MNLPAGLAFCRQCGRVEERDDRGPYCQSCVVASIEKVFVNAADQTRRSKVRCRKGGQDASRRIREVGERRGSRDAGAAARYQADLRHVPVDLRRAQQMQMLSDFLEKNFPSTRARAGLANRGSYLAVLPDMDIAGSPMLNCAINTLCYAHIGAKTGDRRLIQGSQASYGRILSMLINAVQRQTQAALFEPRTVIASMMLLCLYDDSIPMPSDGENGWRAHYWACQKLLGVYGTRCIRVEDPFDKLLFASLRMPCFFLGIAKRKAITFGQADWLQLADDLYSKEDNFTQYYKIAMRIPSILERVDCIVEGHSTLAALDALCRDICQLQQGIATWFAGRVAVSESPLWELPQLVSITEMPPTENHEEHSFMRTSFIFTKILKFGLPMKIVQNYTLRALACIVLDCCLLRLLHFKPATVSCIHPETPEDVEARAFAHAVGLCRSLYHYTTFDGLAYLDFSQFLNDVARTFFDEVGASSESQWCRGLMTAMAKRRARIKTKVQARTLCRMGDAGPGFATACRYKSSILQA